MGKRRRTRVFAGVGAVLASLVVLTTVVLTRADRHPEPGTLMVVSVTATAMTALKPDMPLRPAPVPSAIAKLPKPTLTADTGCRIGRGSAELPAVPAAVSRRVDEAWDRLERWLSGHAPKSAKALPPAASPAAIAKLQKDIGVPLPPELVASLERHDGSGPVELLPSYTPASADGIAYDAKMMCDIMAGLANESAGYWWDGQVVPFAVDGAGSLLVLDQRPGHGGQVGEHHEDGELEFGGRPTSLTDLLEQTATALETGRPLRDFLPNAEKGELDWVFIR
ncbi:SMI1/KNR4 family protein [Amycolatopsis sp. H20-H5]|uniref:SMI1/KNR4 family protein n=1 Tax=Amycolatopsis sp. H20-H5 TaxID=3046309 RepID=UPI002DBC62BA|nr:SMI1/KNR4 family protein [Amycolatopsis sp. H20-H5]MEC3976460.1 SMI1/KNR4 family protein [Amycolatopsis sp. H20-H5]